MSSYIKTQISLKLSVSGILKGSVLFLKKIYIFLANSYIKKMYSTEDIVTNRTVVNIINSSKATIAHYRLISAVSTE